MKKVFFILMPVVLLWLSCLADPASAFGLGQTIPPSTYLPLIHKSEAPKIAFSSYRDHGGNYNYDIYTMNYDGTDQRNLTNSPGWEVSVKWSPDGKKMAFYVMDGDIYLMDADGTNKTRLVDYPIHQSPSFTWSPDGTRIAFTQNLHIFIIDIDGSDLTQFTPESDQWQPFQGPCCLSWSPDGKNIAFTYGPSVYSAVVALINVESKAITSLASGGSPTWSPDGSRIAYISSCRWGCGDLVIMKSDGTTVMNLGRARSSPTWSPDGSRLAFSDFYNIFTVAPDGSALTQLTQATTTTTTPFWSPNGTILSYARQLDPGHYQIFIVDTNGGREVQLTNIGNENSEPQWQPLP